MKMIKSIIITMVLLFPLYSFASPLGQLRISLLEGDVQIYTEDTGEWVPASINMPLRSGDRIWVPDQSRTEIQMRDGTALRFDEQTGLDVLTAEKDSLQVYLAEGRTYANFRGTSGSLLQIDTPSSSFRAYHRAVFRIDTFRNGEVELSVFTGSVYAESRQGRTKVDEGNSLFIREGHSGELSALYPPDEWENWNRDRDRRYVDRRPPSHYLPEELHGYSSDFDEHGRWVYVREYGYVWTPTVVVSAGWAPYRLGRWVWISGDYVWISYEPWGWAPYHYGRWVFVGRVGWCWVPPVRGAVYWGPGFVGWVHTPTYVSWVPLAPGEIYYGYGYYGPHSVNITNIHITNIRVEKVVYRNIHVHNAVTVIHTNTFVRGKDVELKVRENPFLKEKIHVGRPNIKPEFQTKIPVMKEISHDRRPPEPIRKVEVRNVKESRPLVREGESSVFRKEARPVEMPVIKGEERLRTRETERKIDRRGPEPKPGKRPEPKILRKEQGRYQEQRPAWPPERRKDEGTIRREMESPGGRQSPERQVESPAKTGPGRTEPVRPQERFQERRGETGVSPQERRPAEKELRKPGESRPSEKLTPPQERMRQPERESRREIPSVEERRPEVQRESVRERGRGEVRTRSTPTIPAPED